MIIEKYYNEISKILEFLDNLNLFNIDCALVYGSAYNEEMFTKNSDIDLLIMNSNFSSMNLQEICRKLQTTGLNFAEKNPTIIDDVMCKRIEFYIQLENVKFDITLCPGLIPKREILIKNAWYDYFESLMGGVYMRNKIILGQIPDYELFKKEYFPFYDDLLRYQRLDILSNRLSKINCQLHEYINTDNPEAFDYINKYRKYFIKFIYIYYKMYNWTPEKHIYFQLDNYLNLSYEEKNIICFREGDVKKLFLDYANLVDFYLNSYNNEKHLVRKKLKI